MVHPSFSFACFRDQLTKHAPRGQRAPYYYRKGQADREVQDGVKRDGGGRWKAHEPLDPMQDERVKEVDHEDFVAQPAQCRNDAGRCDSEGRQKHQEAHGGNHDVQLEVVDPVFRGFQCMDVFLKQKCERNCLEHHKEDAGCQPHLARVGRVAPERSDEIVRQAAQQKEHAVAEEDLKSEDRDGFVGAVGIEREDDEAQDQEVHLEADVGDDLVIERLDQR